MLVYICIYLSLALYYRAKSRQTKEQFYKRIIILKIVSILEILINPIVAVLIIITAFKKDDGLDEIIIPPKPKKKKFVLPKELRPKLKKLKFDRRHGYISSEVYEKQYNKLLKEAKHLEEQKLAEMEQIEQAKVIELNKQTEEESPKQQPNEQTTQTEEQTKNQETTTQTKEDSLKGTTQE